jgi:hypothetical protein
MASPSKLQVSRSIKASCNTRSRPSRTPLPFTAILAVQIFFLLFWAVGVSAQSLIRVPPVLTRELGSYYLSKLGLGVNSIDYYSVLVQRNIRGSNVYSRLNNIAESESPIDAAAKTSSVRGLYQQNTIGGKVTVEIFYKLLRCEDDSCRQFSRVIATEAADPSGPLALLTYVKTTMGATRWLVNAPQGTVNRVLATSTERLYQDELYRSLLYYKVAQPSPCSSAEPQTLVGSLSELQQLPGFGCMNYNGLVLMVGTSSSSMLKQIQAHALPWEQCDGSLALQYVFLNSLEGPRITRVIRNPGEVPFTVELELPAADAACSSLYSDPDLALNAAQVISGHTFDKTLGFIYIYEQLPQILALGFNGSCQPSYLSASYGDTATGQSEGITENINNQTFREKLIPYNETGACISMLGVNQPNPNTRVSFEDSCAQLFFGDLAQQTEGIITGIYLEPDAGALAEANRTDLENQCTNYRFGISTVLPQIAFDFEEEKKLLLSSTEVSAR